MTALSKPLADALLNHVLRNIPFTAPTTVYVAMNADGGPDPAHPGKTSAAVFGNEATYTGYQRQAVTFGEPTGSQTSIGQNISAVTFPEIPGGGAPFTVTGLSLWTAERGGTAGSSGLLLMAAPIDASRLMEPGDAPLIAAGTLVSTFGQDLP